MFQKIFAKEINARRSDQIPPSVNILKPCINHVIHFKLERNYFEKVYRFSKGDAKTNKKQIKSAPRISFLSKLLKKINRNNVDFFVFRN